MSHADYYLNGNNSACDTLHYQLLLALAGLWKNGGVPTPAVRFASPPVMYFTPLAGLRAKNKNYTDRLRFCKFH
ncbi:MAG: hypothetical protein LBE12_07655 [Planctomycetaceae bacterium]|nr:hypothetical protein [Planctomycetaceae bacterium]